MSDLFKEEAATGLSLRKNPKSISALIPLIPTGKRTDRVPPIQATHPADAAPDGSRRRPLQLKHAPRHLPMRTPL
jgi:hypothetical protein